MMIELDSILLVDINIIVFIMHSLQNSVVITHCHMPRDYKTIVESLLFARYKVYKHEVVYTSQQCYIYSSSHDHGPLWHLQ